MGDNSCSNLGTIIQSPSMKNNNALMKKIQSKFKNKESLNLYNNKESVILNDSQDINFFSKSYTNTIVSCLKKRDDKVLSNDTVINYILTNYNPEFTFHNNVKNDNNKNLDDTIDSSYSNSNKTSVPKHVLTNISNNNEEFTKNNADMLDLEMFENDVKYLRFAALNGTDKYDYKIPKEWFRTKKWNC